MKTAAVIALLLVLVSVGVVLAVSATRPDKFQVERTTSIAAPPDKIFPLIADLRRWQPWSPYEGRDPAMKRTYRGPEQGPGSIYEWDGNSQVGAGRITVRETDAPRRVALGLDMLRPFAANNDVEFALVPAAAGTEVTWRMTGGVPYFAKILHMFMNMDRMVGGDFETGLANLKRIAETQSQTSLASPSASDGGQPILAR